MVQATTLVAWLGVQDCRHIKEHAAGKGGVVFSALEQTGATRLVLLSVLQPSLTHAYLESLSLAWPGEIVLHAFEHETVDMANLWPWAQNAIESSLPAFEIAEPGHEPAFLLGTALPACQAVFLAHGMSGAACRLVEPLRDGKLQLVAVPKIVAGEPDTPLPEPFDECADIPDAPADPFISEQAPDDVAGEGVEQSEGAPADTEVPDAAEWGVEDVALQPVRELEFPEHLNDDLVAAGEHEAAHFGDDAGSDEFAVDATSVEEPQIELLAEDTSDWNVEEVALQPVADLDFDIETETPSADAPALLAEADFDLALPEETVAEEPVSAAVETDFDFALPEESVAEEPVSAAVETDFDFALPEESVAETSDSSAVDADFDALAQTTELTAEMESALEGNSSAAADDLSLEFPDVSADPFDFDAELGKAGALTEEMPAKADEFERLQAEFAAQQAAPVQTDDPFSDLDMVADSAENPSVIADANAPDDQDPFEAAQAALAVEGAPAAGTQETESDPFEAAQAALADSSTSDPFADPSAKLDGLLADDQDPFEAAQAALAAEGAPAAGMQETESDPFEAAQAALADESASASLAHASAMPDEFPADDQDPFEAAQAALAAEGAPAAGMQETESDPFEAAQAALSDDFASDAFSDAADLSSHASEKNDGFPEDHQDPTDTQKAVDQPLSHAVVKAPHATPWPYASAALSILVKRADTLGATEAPVLILGEPGSGAKLLASRMHEHSRRKQQLIVIADLSAIHVDAQGAELWGEVNSLTGAHTAGFVELAQGGTLLIAGLELMTPLVQSQLLALMTRGDIMPMGAEQPLPVDVRVMAAASETLLTELKAGRFNRQLFDLFGKGLLTIPALRKRPEDLPALVDAIWTHIQDSCDSNRSVPSLAVDARAWLLEHGFVGTVRDLELALRRAVLWTRGDEVSVDTLKESLALASVPEAVANCTQAIREGFSLKDVVFSVTKHFVHQALVQSAYDLDQAAELLGVGDSQALLGWMARVDIVLPRNLDEAPKSIADATFENVCDESALDAGFDSAAGQAEAAADAANDPVADAAASLDADFDALAS